MAEHQNANQSTDETADPTGAGPLSGLRVLDLSNGPAGAQATQTLAHPTEHGAPLVFLVDGTDVEGDRLPVFLPVKPNGSKGWVDKAQVDVTANPYNIQVDLSDFKLTLRNGAEVRVSTPVSTASSIA